MKTFSEMTATDEFWRNIEWAKKIVAYLANHKPA